MTECEAGHVMRVETFTLKSGDKLDVEYCAKCCEAHVEIGDWEVEVG